MKKLIFQNKYLILLISIAIAYCYKAFFCGHILLVPEGDTIDSIYSAMRYMHAWAQNGVFPLWNTLSMAGHPFASDTITFLNLYHLGALLWDVDFAYNLVIFSGILLNGIFLFFFLRRRGLADFASFIGALIWMLITANEIDSGFFFLSLCLFLADRYISKKTKIDFLGLTLSIAFYSLNAHPQYFLYGAGFLLIYMYFFKAEREPKMREGFFWLFAPFVLGVGLASFHFLRVAEWTALSNRSSWTLVLMWLPTHYGLLLFPQLFESAARPDLNFIVTRIFQWAFLKVPGLESTQRFLNPPYIGILPIFAALIILRCQELRKNKWIRFFLFTIAFAGLYLTLHPFIYQALVRHIPILGGMTNVGRLFYILQLSFAILAAKMVDALLSNPTLL